jgi:hypothetical protein
MALQLYQQIFPDTNLGGVGMTVIQSGEGSSSAIQIDGGLRLNRQKYLNGEGLLACLELEDRYLLGMVDGITYQQALGYPAANFIDPNAILFV